MSRRLAVVLSVVAALSGLLAVAAALGLFAASPQADVEPERGPPASRQTDQPNILILVSDDQRDGTMRVMPKTRRIFGRGGVEFENGLVTTPQCCPSRASIFSGRYIHNHGVTDNRRSDRIDPTETLQYELKRAGYRTALFGKYLNGFGRTAHPPYFDRSFLRANPDAALHDPRQDYFHARKAIRFLDDLGRRDDDQPWALVVAFRSPHTPYIPAPPYADARVPGRYRMTPAIRERDFSDKNPELAPIQERSTRRAGARVRRGHLRMLMSLDDGVGMIFGAMRRNREVASTLAFYLSDNGWYWGEHGIENGKFLPYLESVRVPLYMRWPGRVAPGSVDRRLAANIDIAPTIYDAAGIEPGYTPDGRSLLDSARRDWLLLEGPSANYHSNKVPLWRSAYFDGDDHFIRWASGFEEHYDLRRDPFELDGRLADERVDGFRTRLDEAENCAGPSCP